MSLIYNGISFSDVLTTLHAYGPAKDPSGSDQLYTTFEIGARSIINPSMLPVKGLDPQSVISTIRHILTQPRKSIYYDITSPAGQQGNNPVINLPSGRDDAGGPWPNEKAFRINYTAAGTLEVYWECIVKLKDCATQANANLPLSLRWEDSISYDSTWRQIYRRTGTVIISSLQNNNIDWFRRNKLSTPVNFGFKRVSSHYTCSKDGLRCDFAFEDQQIRWAPPGNCADLEIIQSESAPMQGGLRKGSLSVRVTGVQNANIIDLARWSLRIAYARVWAANPLRAQGIVPGTIVLDTRENINSCEASTIVQYKVQPNKNRENILGMIADPLAQWAAAAGGEPAFGGAIAAQAAQNGVTPASISYFPWVGYGTTPQSVSNPLGYATWANPSGAMNAPPDGLGLATSIALYAALLQDPCGQALDVTPNAPSAPPGGAVIVGVNAPA